MGHIGYKGPGKFEGEPCYAEQFYNGEIEAECNEQPDTDSDND